MTTTRGLLLVAIYELPRSRVDTIGSSNNIGREKLSVLEFNSASVFRLEISYYLAAITHFDAVRLDSLIEELVELGSDIASSEVCCEWHGTNNVLTIVLVVVDHGFQGTVLQLCSKARPILEITDSARSNCEEVAFNSCQ